MAYDYTYKKPLEELRYYYIRNSASSYNEWCYKEVIQPAIELVRKQYGIRFRKLNNNQLPPKSQEHELVYIVYGPTNPLTMKAEEREYLAALANLGCKVNIISVYPLDAEGKDNSGYAIAEKVVPKLCSEIGINAIFPDNLYKDVAIRSIDWEDLRDNIIGETIRVKFTPTLSNYTEDIDMLKRLHDQHEDDIQKLAKLHNKYHLWHRAVTDGSILFTHDGYWYSSQTKTDKTAMTSKDYCLITSYDEGQKAVTYSGHKLPSSDAPEHLLLSSLLSMHGKRPKMIVHFHHFYLTRGEIYRDLVTKNKLEYGQFGSGRHLLKDLKDKMTVWLIMKEHGLIWTGDSVEEFEDFLNIVDALKFVSLDKPPVKNDSHRAVK